MPAITRSQTRRARAEARGIMRALATFQDRNATELQRTAAYSYYFRHRVLTEMMIRVIEREYRRRLRRLQEIMRAEEEMHEPSEDEEMREPSE